jgi:hypothetical protein
LFQGLHIAKRFHNVFQLDEPAANQSFIFQEHYTNFISPELLSAATFTTIPTLINSLAVNYSDFLDERASGFSAIG